MWGPIKNDTWLYVRPHEPHDIAFRSTWIRLADISRVSHVSGDGFQIVVVANGEFFHPRHEYTVQMDFDAGVEELMLSIERAHSS